VRPGQRHVIKMVRVSPVLEVRLEVQVEMVVEGRYVEKRCSVVSGMRIPTLEGRRDLSTVMADY
jgi:hypothetical protein